MKRILLYIAIVLSISISLFNGCMSEGDKIDYYLSDTTMGIWSQKFNKSIYEYTGNTDTIIISVDTFLIWSVKVNSFIDSALFIKDTILYSVDDFEDWRTKFNNAVDSINDLNKNIIFDSDFRTGEIKDQVSGNVFTAKDGGLNIENGLYGKMLYTNGLGYYDTDSIYDFDTLPITFDFAFDTRGFCNGQIFAQFNTTDGYDIGLSVPRFAYYFRDPNTQIDANSVYSDDSTYHCVITRDASGTVKTYINNVLNKETSGINFDLSSIKTLQIANRNDHPVQQAENIDIYYIKIYNDSKNEYFINNSFNTFYGNYFEAEIHIPTSYNPLVANKWLIYCHGNGGDYTQDPPATWLDSLLDHGYIVAQMSATNNWGNQYGQDAYRSLFDTVHARFNVIDSCNLMTQSMGGLPALNLMRGGDFKAKTCVHNVPAVNLDSMYYDNIFTSGIRTAYDFTTDGQYADSTDGFNPWDDMIIIGIDTTYAVVPPQYFIVGDQDEIAPYGEAVKMNNAIANGQESNIIIVEGVGHSSSIATPTIINTVITWLDTKQ